MRRLLATTALAAALACPALAHDTTTEVDEAIVTVARLPTATPEAPGVRVVGREEIELRQADTAADVLATIPGVSLYGEGAYGGLTSVRIRGASADKTLVLVDGVPMNDPSSPSGAYDFSALDLAEIDRVEVLSGPQSSLWGSQAIGGVVSFTTREADGVRASAEVGSFATVRGRVAVGRSREDWAASAFVSGFRTDGISKADGFAEEDGFEAWTVGLGGRRRIAPGLEVDGRLRFTDTAADLDGFPPPLFLLADTGDRTESESWSGFGRARVDGPWGVAHSFSVSGWTLDRASFGSFPGRFTADRQVWRWTAARDREDERFGFVAGVEHEAVRGDASFADAELATTSAFGVLRFSPSGRVTATLGLRHDDPDRFEGETTLRAAVMADVGGGFRIGASYGQGFKTPTISQILCDFCFAPAVPLTPETADGWDATVGWRSGDGRFDLSVTAFRLEVEDQIAYVGGRYENISRTSAEGVEVDLSGELGGGFGFRAGYAHVDAVDESTGLPLLRQPEHSGSASLFWRGERLEGALTVRAESEQLDVVGFGTGERDGFVVVDLAGAWDFTERVQLTGRIENLFDADYQESFGYGEPGVAAFVGVRLRY